MTGTSIIIPVYNALDFARACLESVYEAPTSVPFEVIVVDNGSTPEVGVWLAREQEQRQHLVVLRFDQPLGFSRAVNEGARRARHDTLVLLNSDTLVTDGWLDGLRDALLSDSRLGVVSPLTNYATNPRQVDLEAEFFHPREYAAKLRDRKELIHEPERVVFFCVMIRRALWELLAGLEEGYGVGNGEDNDFCLRTRLAGYRLAVARNAFVFHRQGHATFRANGLDHEAWMARNLLLYCDRASRWARSLELPDRGGKESLPGLSVIVPVKHGQAAGLRDSLTSLANQTVCGFETIVVSPPGADLSNVVQAFNGRLGISSLVIDESRRGQPAALLNAGLRARKATVDRISSRRRHLLSLSHRAPCRKVTPLAGGSCLRRLERGGPRRREGTPWSGGYVPVNAWPTRLGQLPAATVLDALPRSACGPGFRRIVSSVDRVGIRSTHEQTGEDLRATGDLRASH